MRWARHWAMRWAMAAGGVAVALAVAVLSSCRMPLSEMPGPAVAAAPITLEWDPVTGCAGYKVRFGNSSGRYSKMIDAKGSTTCVISTLMKGWTYYFAVSAYAADGTESGLSNEVKYTARE